MARHNHWIPLHIGDYLSDTAHLTAIEHGGYLLLLMYYAKTQKSLEDDQKRLAQIARMTEEEWAKHGPIIMDFWTLKNNRWFQKRAKIELERAEKVYKARVKAGQNSAIKRKGLARSPSTQREHSDSKASTHRPTSLYTTTSTKDVVGENPSVCTALDGPPPMKNHDVLAHSLPPELRDKEPASEIEKTIVPLKEKKGKGRGESRPRG